MDNKEALIEIVKALRDFAAQFNNPLETSERMIQLRMTLDGADKALEIINLMEENKCPK